MHFFVQLAGEVVCLEQVGPELRILLRLRRPDRIRPEGANMTYESIPPESARELFQSDEACVNLDVRTVEEFTEGHIPGAYNVPIAFAGPMGFTQNPDFAPVMERCFEKDKKLILLCKSGVRSVRACEMLAPLGFSQLINMEGGFHGARSMSGETVRGWAACGFETAIESDAERTWAFLREKSAS